MDNKSVIIGLTYCYRSDGDLCRLCPYNHIQGGKCSEHLNKDAILTLRNLIDENEKLQEENYTLRHTPEVAIVELTGLTANTYQKLALRTEKGSCNNDKDRLTNGLMGLNSEAGEAIDILKKHMYQGHEFNREHLANELGDVAWYLAVSADVIGYDLETIMRMNVKKLEDRYPGAKFDADRSINREEGDV